MSSKDYATTLVAEISPEAAYDAINNVKAWWTEILEGETKKKDDDFKVIFGTTWKAFKITDMVPGKKVEWLVTDCNMPWNPDKTEWTGTKVLFEIHPSLENSQKTEVKFTHIGLVPESACYKECEKGWDYYLKSSLLPLLTLGKGNPETK